jgi:5-methylcytosine-specific restriction endonuclease McrBC GTP-binding regulatory subunit McrB
MPNANILLSNELIKRTIDENKYIPDEAKDHMTTEEFSDMYGLEALKSYGKSRELLYFLFGNLEHNENSLTYSLENIKRITIFFGEAKPGFNTTKILNNTKGSWKNYKRVIDENEAIEIAYSICNALINTLENISEDTDATEIRDMLNKYEIKTNQNWLKKYFTILYPKKFMPMLNDDWTSRIFIPLGLTPKYDWFVDSKAFSEKSKEFGIDSVALYHVVFKCATEQIKSELKELGIDASQLASPKNLLVNTRQSFNDIKKYIKSEDLQTKFEKYLSDRYNWDSEPETTTTTVDETISEFINDYSKKLKVSKNIIFRGAPGTGKTYLAKEIAADIISGGSTTDISKVNTEQWAFVQFHPNYDYSDFIEGLRPIMNTDNSLGFKLQDGVFKTFVNKARKNYEDSTKTDDDIKKEASFQNTIKQFLDTVEYGETEFSIKKGNEFFITNVDDDYLYINIPANLSRSNTKLSISKLKNLIESGKSFNKVTEISQFFGQKNNTMEDSYYYSIFKKLLKIQNENKNIQNSTTIDKPVNKPYVFIIDEINRGEISKILGELFFSIDPGYRGKAGEISTQYSNMHADPDEKFYIPDNVYIIGTMNDIDRSVDSFDFAMRRRFRFIEIKASDNTKMLDQLGNEDLKREAIERMNRLNNAIVEVDDLNENYQIGASYFLKLDTLSFKDLWTDCLKPLLSDYIQGMYDEKSIMEKFEKAYFSVSDEGTDDETE